MKYRHPCGNERKTMRWMDFDYSSQGAYFVTIVTYCRKCLFGNSIDGMMHLNEAGEMIMNQYHAIETTHENVHCMDVVIMPNHIHFIIYIDKDGGARLPEIMRKFKSTTAACYCAGVKEKGWTPIDAHLWQRSYWDVVIWNAREFDFIRRYIYLNPQRWERDAINENHGQDIDDINASIKLLKQI